MDYGLRAEWTKLWSANFTLGRLAGAQNPHRQPDTRGSKISLTTLLVRTIGPSSEASGYGGGGAKCLEGEREVEKQKGQCEG